MTNHGPTPFPLPEDAPQEALGPTGQYPDGKLRPVSGISR